MTPFKQALIDIAEHSPPLGDTAQRAVTSARRRRRVLALAPPSLAVALVAMAALLMNGFSPIDRNPEPVVQFPDTQTVTFPTQAPEPLPSQGVATAKLAYTVMCGGTGYPDCAQWRLLTTDGRQFRLADAIQPQVRNGMLEHDGALALSPDGRRIAYFDEGGRFLIRDLSRGGTRSPFTMQRPDLAKVTPHIAWSPDQRRLTVDFEPVDDESPVRPAARLVDLATMRTTTLPLHCCVLGLGAGDTPTPMYDAYATNMGGGEILWIGDDGAARRRLPIGNVELSSIFPRLPGNTSLSADGRRFAALLWPQPAAGVRPDEQVPELVTIDADHAAVTRPRVPARLPTYLADPTIMGWRDASTVLLGNATLVTRHIPAGRAGIHAVDLETGKIHQLVRFTAEAQRMSVAADLL